MSNKGDVLDDGNMISHTNDYNLKHGPSFGVPARLAASIFTFFFLMMFCVVMVNRSLVGILIVFFFLLPLSFVLTAHTGVILSIKSKYFKEYSTYLGIKFGKWKSSKGLTDVAVLTIRKTKRVSSTFGGGVIDIENKETGVYFLIRSHRKRVLINICKSKYEADRSGQDLANVMDKTFTIFNPQVSEASKARRYR
jgi:hypothetical protein